jgi:phosphoribosylaminoimidazolecarboxamide formyltransferase/IMP cyclohydrolase
MKGRIPIRRAVVSVYDKTGLADFAKRLCAAGVEIVSSGGTARALREAGLEVTEVGDVTGAPEILGGRVKTLHPGIHGGILAIPGNHEHTSDLAAQGIDAFQLVVSNLYPFVDTVAAAADEAAIIEEIDIGGPALTRAAAKNHAHVGVVTSPDQYDEVAAEVEAGGLPEEMRRALAREAFFRTAAYDAAIVGWLERDEGLPERMVLPLRRRDVLRYGENPHQEAAVYRAADNTAWWDAARQLQGKEMSFNNLVDAEAAWRLAGDLAGAAAVVVKHTNPCGAAARRSISDAFSAAWACDPTSAFGGVVALNRPVDVECAALIAEHFIEVVVAPVVTPPAQDLLAGRNNLRVLEAPPVRSADWDVRRLEGGALLQRHDQVERTHAEWEVATGAEPDADRWADIEFAWTVAAHTKSNAVVIAADRAAVAVGAGDQSRVGAAERAVRRAGERAAGAVAASDAFFPFRDGLDVLADAGVTAIVEPGGSRRDDEVIAAATERGITLVFTGRRHFRH